MEVSPRKASSVGEELLLHSRYIRDTLVPLLAKQPKLSHSDTLCLRSIFNYLEATPMTLDLCRHSRIHKALMVIAATGDASWPLDILVRAEKLITKWEDELGPLQHLRVDLYGPGGRMEGVRKLTWKGERVLDDVPPVQSGLSCLNNISTGGEVSMVCRRVAKPISSTCYWPYWLRGRRVSPFLHDHSSSRPI